MEIAWTPTEKVLAELSYKSNYWPIYTDDTIEPAIGNRAVACVGDVCSLSVIKAGLTPRIVIVDGKTKRDDETEEIPWTAQSVPVFNPAGCLMSPLFEAVRRAYSEPQPTKINVMGEEDLATLPCVLYAPFGSVVVFGVPDRGMAIIEVTEASKRLVKGLLEQGELRFDFRDPPTAIV